MNEIEYKILKYLLSKSAPVKSKILQDVFHISRRSVINYIKALNDNCDELILSSSYGYSITDRSKASELLSNVATHTFYGYEQRKKYILEKLLLTKHSFTIENMIDELFISEATANKDISKLRLDLKPYNLYIHTKNNSLFLIGEKKDKHKFLKILLSEEWQNANFEISSLQHYFETAKIDKIRNIIVNILKKQNLHLDDFSLLNYVLHLSICIETSPQQDLAEQETFSDFSSQFNDVVYMIYKELKKLCPDRAFTLNDVAEASVVISTRITYSKNTPIEIDNYIEKEITDLMDLIGNSLYNSFGIRLNEPDFVLRFTFHLKNVVKRVRSNIQLPINPLLSIKQDYPLIYMLATYVSSIISNYTGKTVSETETTYIALHLGALMQEYFVIPHRFSCVIIIYNYIDLGNRIFDFINKYVKNIYLAGIISSYSELNLFNNIDLILTTLDIDPLIDIPQIKVNFLPTDHDINVIQKEIENLKIAQERKELIENIKSLFHEDLFFTNIDLPSKKEIISFLCHKMEEKNYITKDFILDIWEHENIISTEYNNIAIPHPLSNYKDHIKQSIISVWINKEPATWLHNKVYFVFMLALCPNDLSKFSNIFNIIISALSKEEIFYQLLNCKTLDEFIELLILTE